MLAGTLASYHNLYFYQRLMRDARVAIASRCYALWARETIARVEREECE